MGRLKGQAFLNICDKTVAKILVQAAICEKEEEQLVREGTLLIQHHQLFFTDKDGKEELLQVYTHMEIYLSTCWIPGEFQSSTEHRDKIREPFDLVCDDGSFCGLRTGMRVRVFDPGELEQPE